SGDERDAVQTHAHFDDLDGLLTRHVFGDENVYFPLHEIIHHQLFTGQLLVEMEYIDHVAIRELKANHGRRTWRGRSQRFFRGPLRYLGSLRWLGTSWFVLTQNNGRAGKHERRDAKKAVHSLVWMDGRR